MKFNYFIVTFSNRREKIVTLGLSAHGLREKWFIEAEDFMKKKVQWNSIPKA